MAPWSCGGGRPGLRTHVRDALLTPPPPPPLPLLLLLLCGAVGVVQAQREWHDGHCVSPDGLDCVNCDDEQGGCSDDRDWYFSWLPFDIWHVHLFPLSFVGWCPCVCSTGGTGCTCADGLAPGDYASGGFEATERLCTDIRSVQDLQRLGREERDAFNEASMTLLSAFIFSVAGIWCCIKHKRRTTNAEPSPAAWVSCLLIFFFAGPLGPCLMWAPFAIDACYRTPGRTPLHQMDIGERRQNARGGPQPVIAVAVTQPQPITAVAVPYGIQQHGESVTATAVDNSWDSVRGQPIVTGHVVRP